MIRPLWALLLFAAALPLFAANGSDVTVTLLHFSDYHSHALPFYSEGADDQGGLARAIGYLRHAKANGALVFSGGDMINKGSPAWSDKYRCAEWPWFNGVVDAMAFGNHDADYGPDDFAKCRASIRYPILGANVLDAAGKPLFTTAAGPNATRYAVFSSHGLRIGVFAIAGADFDSLVHKESRPAAGATFAVSIDAAREMVKALREKEHVDAVVMIGHEQFDADEALAHAVPGIDVIFGTHSHFKQDLEQIEGTRTWIISPFQYLTYISRVTLTFRGHDLVRVGGGLVRVDSSMAPDPEIARKVATMQHDLERDPGYKALFTQIATAATPLAVEGQFERDSAFGDLTMDVMRSVSGAHFALSTASSFRQSIAAGPITMESLRASLPYDNAILVYSLTGEQIEKLLAVSISKRGTDFFCQLSGVRFTIDETERDLAHLSIVKDPNDSAAGFEQVDQTKHYRVATTDYVARVAPGYREIFEGLTPETPGLHLRDEVRKYLIAHSPVSIRRDARITNGN